MSKVDEILQEIYFEMEMEEIDKFLTEIEEAHLSEEGEGRALGKMTLGQLRKLKDNVTKAKAAGDSEWVTKATQALNRAKFKWSKFKANTGISQAKTAVQKAAGEAGKKVSKVAGEAGEKAKGLLTKAGKTDVGKKISGAAGQAKQLVTQNPEAAAAAAAVAAVAAGVVIYKKFFSQSARACKGKSGSDKANCVKSFKVKGLMAAKAKVSSGIAKCKDPKCKAKLQAKAQSFDAKISSMKGAVSEAVIDEYVGDFMSEVFEQASKSDKG